MPAQHRRIARVVPVLVRVTVAVPAVGRRRLAVQVAQPADVAVRECTRHRRPLLPSSTVRSSTVRSSIVTASARNRSSTARSCPSGRPPLFARPSARPSIASRAVNGERARVGVGVDRSDELGEAADRGRELGRELRIVAGRRPGLEHRLEPAVPHRSPHRVDQLPRRRGWRSGRPARRRVSGPRTATPTRGPATPTDSGSGARARRACTRRVRTPRPRSSRPTPLDEQRDRGVDQGQLRRRRPVRLGAPHGHVRSLAPLHTSVNVCI